MYTRSANMAGLLFMSRKSDNIPILSITNPEEFKYYSAFGGYTEGKRSHLANEWRTKTMIRQRELNRIEQLDRENTEITSEKTKQYTKHK